MINLSASPFDYTHVDDRKAIIKANVNKYKLPLLYCNAVGSQTEIVFDGGSFIFDQHANLIAEGKYFEEDLISVVIQDDGNIEMPIISNAADLPSQELNPLMYDHTLNIP